jgi:hypothetical protein
VPGSITFPGPPAPAVPIEVVAVIDDVGTFAEFARFPGAIDVVVTQAGGPVWLPPVGTAWWLVSPHGHRVAAVPIVCDVTPEGRADARFEIHLAVGRRDSWLVHAGDGWLLQPTAFPEGDGIEALLLRITEPSRRRSGTQLTFAIDRVWAPLLRGANEVSFADVLGHPAGTCTATTMRGAPSCDSTQRSTVPADPWLNVGAVYRLQPTVSPELHLVADHD